MTHIPLRFICAVICVVRFNNMKNICPWCSGNLSLSHPGVVRTEKKWNGIPLYPKAILVCPHCNKKIAQDTKSSRWLILMLPLLGILLWRAWTLEHWSNWFENIGWLEWGAVLLTFIGIAMASLTSHYVKAE